jgi:hypothetical protein
LARLLLQRTDLLGGVTGEDRGVLPLRVGHGRGDDVLLHPVQVVAYARGVVDLLGPVAAHTLEGQPADQKPVRLVALAPLLGEQI